MDVRHQLVEVRFLFADNGFVAILEQVPDPRMSAVEILGITAQQAAHEGGDAIRTAFQEDVRMVRHESESVDSGTRAPGLLSHAVEKRFPVHIVTNNAAPLDPPDNHMMQGSRRVKSRSSRHRTLPFYFARKSGFLLISRYQITAFLATDQRPEVLHITVLLG